MKLYEYAIIYTGPLTKEEKERGETAKGKLVVDVTRVLANDDKQALLLAARAIPDEYIGQLNRIDIAVRPF